MEISIRQTSIKPDHICRLLSHGIVLITHLNAFDTQTLKQRTKLSLDECEQILNAVKPKRPHYVMRASELMVKPFEKITTLIKDLDFILGGGIRCGQVTEISGEAGTGKSNLCAQMGVLVMLPKEDNGLDGDVLLINTEGEGKLVSAIKRYSTLAESMERGSIIKARLNVMNCVSDVELNEIINRLPEILNQQPTVKLVIIDSITCAFISTDREPDYRFYLTRNLILTKMVKNLSQIAWDRRIAVIVTNHVSYNFRLGENMPKMGKIWSHLCQTKIYLDRNKYRYAHVTKGAINTPTPVEFIITNKLYDT